MKKIDESIEFLTNHLDLFQCPKCNGSFTQIEGNQIKCKNNHTFDVSKKGTVHFLLHEASNQYTKEMLEARSNIAEVGFWTPILDNIYDNIKVKNGNHLDIGCGEGSHLNYLYKQGLGGNRIGFDISKDGIKLAASQYRNNFWCVADLADSPFSANTFTSIFNVFSPSNYNEFQRLLVEGGQIFKVVPTENYLKEVRTFLYGSKKEYSNEKVIANFASHYPDYQEILIAYNFELNNNQLRDLSKMTPLVWSADQEKVSELANLETMNITIEVLLLIGEKK